MKSLKRKRIMAYILDYIIINIIVSLITIVPFVNPNYELYEKYTEKYFDSYNEYVNDANETNMQKIIDNSYYLVKYGIIYSVIEIAVIISYLGIYQFQHNGQTIGKKWQKIKIVKTNGAKNTITTYIIRAIILYNIVFTSINLVAASFLSSNQFIIVNSLTSVISSLIGFVILLSVLIRKDGIALHDKICKTKVIEI